ncbi:MAG: hypothetical protein R3Y33_06830 [Clostridia bacterium]
MGIFDIFKSKSKLNPKEEIIKTDSIILENTVSKYRLDNIRFIDEKQNDLKRYIIENENCSIVQNDIDYLLSMLKETLKENDIKLGFVINKEINFDISNYDKGHIDFAFLKYEPLTATGKLSKYPLELHIYSPHDPFNISFDKMINANVFYLKDGTIGKARMWVWNKHIIHVFHYAIKEKKLIVTKIEKTAKKGYDKDIIYSYKK